MKIFVHEFVTGGGFADVELPPGLAVEGGLMRRALDLEFSALPDAIVSVTLDARLPAQAGSCRLVRVGPGEEREVFQQQVSQADLTLVIAPETDGCLETRARWIEEAGGRSLGSDPEAIAITADKFQCFEVFRQSRIRTPTTYLFSRYAGLPPEFTYPAVLKPIDGAGTLDTLIIDSPEDRNVLDRFPHPVGILQPYLPGRAMSAGFLVDRGGNARLIAIAEQSIVRQENSLHYAGGTLLTDSRIKDQQVDRALSSIKGLQGFVGVDFLWDEREACSTVIEINPRPTTSMSAMLEKLEPGLLAREWIEMVLSGGFEPGPASRTALLRLDEPYPFKVVPLHGAEDGFCD